MTTFDLDAARAFTDLLKNEMDRCDVGEGTECATLDAALRQYARTCCGFRDAVRHWGRSVFAGEVEYIAEVEETLFDEGLRLFARAMLMWQHAQQSEEPCYTLEGRIVLQAALWDLQRLITNWVSPDLAVGPAARNRSVHTDAELENACEILASLPALPEEWEPDDHTQKTLYRKLKKS